MKIYLAADHAGFELKEKVKKFLQEKGHEVQDFGAFSYDEKDDYPDFIKLAAEAVSKCAQGSHNHSVIASETKQSDNSVNVRSPRSDQEVGARDDGCMAIVLGASGQGEAMVANRHKGVRAAVLDIYSEEVIKLSRQHNDANVLSLGARFLKEQDALKAVDLWLSTEFSAEERHVRRLAKF